jgi:chromosome segregation ATPase
MVNRQDEPEDMLAFGHRERRRRVLPGGIRRPGIAAVTAGLVIGGLALAVVVLALVGQGNTQVSQAQRSLAHDTSVLKEDARGLAGDSHASFVSDIQQIQSHYGKEQSDYQAERQHGSCRDGSIRADAAAVAADSPKVDTDLSSTQADVQQIQGEISGVKDDMSVVRSDMSTLKKLRATPGTDPSGAFAADNKALSDAGNAVAQTSQQANMIDRQAHQLATTAQSYAKSHCG